MELTVLARRALLTRSRKRSSIIILVAAALLMAACGGNGEPEATGVASANDLAETTVAPTTAVSTTAAVITADADDASMVEGATSGDDVDSNDIDSDDALDTPAVDTADTPEEMTPIEEQELALLDLSACMRDEGVEDFPDVSVDNNGAIDIAAVLQSGVSIQSPEFTDAFEVCAVNVSDVTFSAAAVPDPAEIIDQLFDFTQCLRDEGIDVGDLSIADLGSRQQVAAPEGASTEEAIAAFFGLDPDDPAVIAAIETCDVNLAGLPGAG